MANLVNSDENQLDIFTDVEIWKDIPGWEGYYQASTWGQVRSLDRITQQINNGTLCLFRRKGQLLKKSYDTDGYVLFSLCRNGTSYTAKAHRIISQTFLSNPDNKPFINHKNGIKDDNRIVNLEWCTAKENTIHSYDTGLQVAVNGKKQWKSKLNDENILDIRSRHKNGETVKEIHKVYPFIGRTAFYPIIKRKSWKHLP